MCEATVLDAARSLCAVARVDRDRSERGLQRIVAMSLRHGLPMAEVAELTGLTAMQIEEYRERGT